MGAVTNSMPLCIITEFLPGGNLADILARVCPPPPASSRAVATLSPLPPLPPPFPPGLVSFYPTTSVCLRFQPLSPESARRSRAAGGLLQRIRSRLLCCCSLPAAAAGCRLPGLQVAFWWQAAPPPPPDWNTQCHSARVPFKNCHFTHLPRDCRVLSHYPSPPTHRYIVWSPAFESAP